MKMMKQILGTLWKASLPMMVMAMLAGCAWFGHTPASPDELRAYAYTLSSEAAYVGAGIDLEENPAHRAAYQVTVEALRALVDRTNFDALALSQALQNLPNSTLAGAQGALVAEGIVSVWSVASARWLQLDSQPVWLAVAEGALTGLQRALARPQATAGLRRPAPKTVWPKQCVPPARKK